MIKQTLSLFSLEEAKCMNARPDSDHSKIDAPFFAGDSGR